MPSSIRPGSTVQGLVGPLEAVTNRDTLADAMMPADASSTKRKRSTRGLRCGIVVGAARSTSKPHSWRVLWEDCAKTCDHTSRTLKLVRYTDTTFDRSCFSRLLPEDYLLSVVELYNLFDSGKYDNILKLSPIAAPSTAPTSNLDTEAREINFAGAPIDDNMPALLYRRQISTSIAAASSSTASSTAAPSTAPTSNLDTEAREINFAGAGHDEDDDSDDDSDDEDSTPTEDARSQNLLSPTRNTIVNESSESPKDDTIDDLRLEGDHAFDETRVLRDIMEWEPSFDKYQSATNKYLEEKAKIINDKLEVVVGKGVKRTTWGVVDDVKESDLPVPVAHFKQIGIRGFDFSRKPTEEGGDSRKMRNNFLELIIHMWPGNWKEQLDYVNLRIEELQVKLQASGDKKVLKIISENEFWRFFGLLLAARLEGRTGTLWDTNHSRPAGILRAVDYSKYMSRTRFTEIRQYMAFIFADRTLEGIDDWWQIMGGVNGFNANRLRIVQSPNVKVLDETMSAYRPRTTKFGTLPYLSFILRKPEPLGTEFKTLATVGGFGMFFDRTICQCDLCQNMCED
jgi:hypothetical protein